MATTEDKPKRDRRKREYPCFVRIYAVDDAEMEHRYCGSTELELEERLSEHKRSATRETSKFYRYMREQGPETFTITLLNEFTANSKDEDNEAEDQAILMFGDLNTNRAVPQSKEGRRRSARMYERSDKGRASTQRYRRSDKGKTAITRFNRTEAGKARLSKYYNKPENTQPIYCHCTQRSYTTLVYHQSHKHSKRHLLFMKDHDLPEL